MNILRGIKWLKPLLVALFVSYYVGGTAFTHTHYYQAHYITHSHPYWPNADGLPGHEHSFAAFETIALLNHFTLEAFSMPLFTAVWVLLLLLFSVCLERPFRHLFRHAVSRAPPSWPLFEMQRDRFMYGQTII